MARKNRNARAIDQGEPFQEQPMADTLDLGSWFILRMASADTLRIHRNLTNCGMATWTPIERKFGRTARTRTRFEKEVALLPSYVFAKVECLDDILRIAMLPSKDVGRFSVFHHKGGIPLIADDQLRDLRAEESRVIGIFERLKRKGMKGPQISKGAVIKMQEGPFAGLSGVVEGQQGQNTLVSFAGYHRPIKIASLLLHPGVVTLDNLPRDLALKCA